MSAVVEEVGVDESAGEDAGAGAESTNGKGGSGRKPGTPNVPVTWGLRPIERLPERKSPGVRTSEVHAFLEQVKQSPGQPFVLGEYGDDDRADTSARGKASALRKQYKSEDGWEFRVGEVDGSIVLTVQYG